MKKFYPLFSLVLFALSISSVNAKLLESVNTCVSYRNDSHRLFNDACDSDFSKIVGTQAKVLFRAEANDEVKLDVTLNWDPETEIPISIAIMGGDEPFYGTLDGFPADGTGFWIPIPPEQQGVKQVVLCMKRTTYFGFNGEYKFLIYPDCDLTNSFNLTINTEDADKLISFVTYNPNGELSTLDKIELGENGLMPIENGNIRCANIETYLRYKNHTFYPQNTLINMDFEMEDEILGNFPGLALKDVYVNCLPDDWSIIQYRSMFASDRENQYTVILEAHKLEEDKTIITNNAESYSLWKPKFESTLIPDNALFSIFPLLKNDGKNLTLGMSIYINDDKCWTSIPEDLSDGLSVQIFSELNTSLYERIMISPYMEFDFDGPHEYVEYPVANSLATTSSIDPPMATNPYFSIPFSDMNVSGTSSPFIVLGMAEVTESVQFSYPYLDVVAAGSLGEKMLVVSEPKYLSVSCNGNAFFQNSKFQDYSQAYVNAGCPKGNLILEANFINFTQDGLQGEVNLVSKWNNADDPDDTVPPTLTFLQLKNKDNIAVSRFNTPSDAVVAFSAGDFEPKVIMNAFVEEDFVYNHDYVEYRPLSEVRFEVAPHGSDTFIKMPVTEIPDCLVERGFGAYYSVDISDLDMKSTSGWFDIRITLTDSKGNTQEQTISPALKIESGSSVEEVNEKEDQIFVTGNSIIAPSNTQVYSGNGIEYGKDDLPAGIYIVKTGDRTKKLIIK